MREHVHRGARALVLLHERELRRFLTTWRRAAACGVVPHDASQPDYASPEALLRHVLGCARHYMVWTCETLGLPAPGIRAVPDANAIEAQAEAYLEHVLEGWSTPLSEVPEERFEAVQAPASWGTIYCVDAMLEHAVMHPIRHTFQLEERLAERG